MIHSLPDGELHVGHVLDSLAAMPAESVQTCITSPPYWGLRKYAGEQVTAWSDGDWAYGLEDTPERWADHTAEWLRAVRRVLRKDGTVWLNVGDSYAHGEPGGGSVFANGRSDGRVSYETDNVRGREKRPTIAAGYKPLDLIHTPSLLIPRLLADGWYLRSVIVWAKPNPMPESVSGTRWERHKVKRSHGTRATNGYQQGAGTKQGPGVASRSQREAYFEEGVGATEWADCEGCATCASNDGLVLRRGSWRPTEATEWILFLSKTKSYFADGVAVQENTALPEALVRRQGIGTQNVVMKGAFSPSSHSHSRSPLSLLKPTTLLELVELQNQFRLAFLDPQVGQESLYHTHSDVAMSSPRVKHVLSEVGGVRFVEMMRAAKGSLEEFNSFWSNLSDADRLSIARIISVEGLPASLGLSVLDDAESTIGVNDSSQISIDGFHDEHYTTAQYPSSGRNLRNVWLFPTEPYKFAHFATYPTELVRRCILASTPDAGCCSVCGAPWARVLERKAMVIRRTEWGTDAGNRTASSGTMLEEAESQTLGWRPTCSHDAPAQPSIVLDPFGGSGTTGVVARSLGRRFVLCELSESYVQMALRRLAGTQPALVLA